jgi:hypothetical protein
MNVGLAHFVAEPDYLADPMVEDIQQVLYSLGSMSATHHLPSSAWETIRYLTAHLGIVLIRFGASSTIVYPCNQRPV